MAEFSSFEKRGRVERQGGNSRVDFDVVASSRPGNDGKRCIDKVARSQSCSSISRDLD